MKAILPSIFLILAITFIPQKGETTVLTAGDLVLTSMNADGTDDFSFVLLVDISGTTEVHFTDNGWDSNTNNWGTASDGIITWTLIGALSFGTEVSITNSTVTPSASHGTVVKTGSFNVSGGGDQLLVYSGTVGSPTFIYAFNHRANCWSPCSVGSSSLNSNLPPGLTEGTTALTTDPTHHDNWQYNCAVASGSKSVLQAAIANVNNYNFNDTSPLGGPACGITLPIELSRFVAESVNHDNGSPKIVLSWQTISEIDNHGFEIEKSINGRDWQVIDFIAGKGTTIEKQDYQFIDIAPFPTINYYRLKQVDFNGQFEYSKIVSVVLPSNDHLTIFPNPTSGMIELVGDKLDNVQIIVLNGLGNVILQQNNYKQHIDLSGFPNGIYFIQVNDGNRLVVREVLKH